MRLHLLIGAFAIALLGCRTEPLDPSSARATPQAVDLSTAAPAHEDLRRRTDLAGEMDVCSPENPKGDCPAMYTCCPYSCWGGSDETGWCYHGDGCPVC